MLRFSLRREAQGVLFVGLICRVRVGGFSVGGMTSCGGKGEFEFLKKRRETRF